MPNRIIKESICASESVDELSWFEEVFFYRLIVNCDDYGRMDARPAILKARLFPLKERIALKDVSGALQKLADVGCVRLYDCDSKPYLYLPSWEVHQSIRAKKSKFPSPDNVNAHEINCMQMISDDCKCSRNPIQSESNPIRESESLIAPSKKQEVAGGFDEFWDCYPKKVGKKDALKAWNKLKPNDKLKDTIIAGIRKWNASDQWTKDNGQYIPHPATFLNGERWKDDCKIAKGIGLSNDRDYDYDEISRLAAQKLAKYGKGE